MRCSACRGLRITRDRHRPAHHAGGRLCRLAPPPCRCDSPRAPDLGRAPHPARSGGTSDMRRRPGVRRLSERAYRTIIRTWHCCRRAITAISIARNPAAPATIVKLFEHSDASAPAGRFEDLLHGGGLRFPAVPATGALPLCAAPLLRRALQATRAVDTANARRIAETQQDRGAAPGPGGSGQGDACRVGGAAPARAPACCSSSKRMQQPGNQRMLAGSPCWPSPWRLI